MCPAGSAPLTVQIVDESSMGLQLSTADMAAVSPQGNRLGHVGVSIQQVTPPFTYMVVSYECSCPVLAQVVRLAGWKKLAKCSLCSLLTGFLRSETVQQALVVAHWSLQFCFMQAAARCAVVNMFFTPNSCNSASTILPHLHFGQIEIQLTQCACFLVQACW